MSDASTIPTESSGHSDPAPPERSASPPRSFLESFISSFFHEQNIKWMLIVGAAIVFGSSLMLVTRNWALWGNSLKYCAIFGYTVAIFFAAEVSRKRLALSATYKVLHSLTLLLLPILFLALRWLSANSATQMSGAVELMGFMLPAIGFLWFAATRILDHQLSGRQTSFVASYCLLSIAGALPPITNPMVAMAFMGICWTVMTIGIVKVNRHVFWLTEEHRLPRVFGFFPIAVLGLMFCVLVGTKAMTTIPVQWMGLGVVMMSATVLLTARTVASVFRQRTGDLVRPYPWSISIPLFVSLVMAILGVTLSFTGFTYVGVTTYAVIPTAAVAAGLMFVAAADTRQSGFVWVGLVCSAIAYQTSPVLFADVVQILKSNTAAAINRERVPLSLYGVTYLPLLCGFALISRQLMARHLITVHRPIKHFVTLLAMLLFAFSATDTVSLFFVASANVISFALYAILFRDRRYGLVSVVALIIATAIAVPALADMAILQLPVAWSATALAGLSILMTLTRLPDRLLNRIPLSSGSVLRHRNAQGHLTATSQWFQTSGGSNREIVRGIGLVLAQLMAGQWIVSSLVHLHEPLSVASMWQYGLLMSAFVVHSVRSPGYFAGLFFWVMGAFAVVRWGLGLQIEEQAIFEMASVAAAGLSLLCYLVLKWTGHVSWTFSLNDLRKQLGFDARLFRVVPQNCGNGKTSQARLLQASVVPLCDLSLVVLACLAAPFHLLQLLSIHGNALTGGDVAGQLGLSTMTTVGWLVAATMVFRSRVTGIAMAVVLPLVATAIVLSAGIRIVPMWWGPIWAVPECLLMLFAAFAFRNGKGSEATTLRAIRNVADVWLNGILFISCLSFELPFRVAALMSLGTFLLTESGKSTASRNTFNAIVANIQVLLFAGWWGGASGPLVTVLRHPDGFACLPCLFVATAISVPVFDVRWKSLDRITSDTWSAILKAAVSAMTGLLLIAEAYDPMSISIVCIGLMTLAIGELVQSVRRAHEAHVWFGYGAFAGMALFLLSQGVFHIGNGRGQYAILGTAMLALAVARLGQRDSRSAVLVRPSLWVGRMLPAFSAVVGIVRFLQAGEYLNPALNSLAMMTAAGIYAHQSVVTRQRRFALLAGVIMNAGLIMLWQSLNLHALELYLVPVGVSILAFVELLKKELSSRAHDPLRYIGALTILVSPLFEVLDGSWAHMLVLMVLSTLLVLLAIGLRIRVLMFAGSAFLFADLLAMVVRSTVDHPSLLWAFGIAFGIGVIALAAFCENHREKLLARIRLINAELATWQ